MAGALLAFRAEEFCRPVAAPATLHASIIISPSTFGGPFAEPITENCCCTPPCGFPVLAFEPPNNSIFVVKQGPLLRKRDPVDASCCHTIAMPSGRRLLEGVWKRSDSAPAFRHTTTNTSRPDRNQHYDCSVLYAPQSSSRNFSALYGQSPIWIHP